MRRRILLTFLVLGVTGMGQAPGTYPEEETRQTGEYEVPRNPYQSAWTGYEYFYEKEPKKLPSTGKMPEFQSIVSTDKESPDDPEEFGFKSSGAESPAPPTTTTTTTTNAPVAVARVEVAPTSSTTGTVSTSTPTTTTSTGMYPLETLTTHAPAPAPEAQSDEKASQILVLYQGEEKGDHDPKNLLTAIIEKKRISPVSSEKLKSGDSYDDLGGPSGYQNLPNKGGHAPGAAPHSTGGSGYGTHENTSKSSTLPPEEVTVDSGYGTHENASKPSTLAPEKVTVDYGSHAYQTPRPSTSSTVPKDSTGDSGYGSNGNSYKASKPQSKPGEVTVGSGYGTHENASKPSTLAPEEVTVDYGSHTYQTSKPSTSSTVPKDSTGSLGYGSHAYQTPKPSTSSAESDVPYASESEPQKPTSSDVPTTPSPVTSSKYSGDSDPDPYDSTWQHHQETLSSVDLNHYHPLIPSSSFKAKLTSSESFPPPHHFTTHKDTIPEPRGIYSADDEPYPTPKHIGIVPSSRFPPGTAPDTYSNSNNAISPRDPYDHFGTVPHHAPAQSLTFRPNEGDFEEEHDGGYETNGVLTVPDRSTHPYTRAATTDDIRAQVSEIDRIAELFENSAREPVEYEHKITSESSKGIIAEAGKSIAKKFGRNARQCCSCCDEKQPVSRQVDTKIEPSVTKQLVTPAHLSDEDPAQNFIHIRSSFRGNAYVQPSPQTHYQQPFQQYQPQYPQSYPYQSPQTCGCQPQPQNCCAAPAPCCLPTIPCCPPIPCCPQPKICCQPQPICLPPPTCCQISFQVPTIPVCGRACPACPCRRRVHKSQRLKRHAISSSCNRCSAAGEPWKTVIHRREKRFASGCSSRPASSCGNCGASHLRSTRVKRMGCLPCLGRKKRNVEENSHLRVKRMGCLPCLGRKKRSALSNCSQCNSLGHLFNRYKRSLFGCSPCSPCSCSGRKKRSLQVKMTQCDATCCDYSKCPNRQKKEALVPFM